MSYRLRTCLSSGPRLCSVGSTALASLTTTNLCTSRTSSVSRGGDR
jgi:hypothetical protein